MKRTVHLHEDQNVIWFCGRRYAPAPPGATYFCLGDKAQVTAAAGKTILVTAPERDLAEIWREA